MFTGYKFEALALLPRPWAECSRDLIERRALAPVNNAEQYCSVVETGIADAKLVLGGEVDGVWDAKPADPSRGVRWVELKCCAQPGADARGRAFLARKLLKWWAQSFLIGCPKIIVGMRGRRDAVPTLREVVEFETAEVPGVHSCGVWEKETCMRALEQFVGWVREHVTAEGVWEIEQAEGANGLRLQKVAETGHDGIVSEEFVRWRMELAEREAREGEAPVGDPTV